MSQNPTQIVEAFCAAFAVKDIEFIVAAMAPDCVYENVPIPAMHGRDAFRAFISHSLTKTDKLEFVMKAIAANGDKVLTERVDIFHYGKDQVAIPLMGIFVVKDGLIAEWRDYADINSFVTQMTAIGQAPGPGVAT